MNNPAEGLVTVWLQEKKDYFTKSNIIVETKKGGRKPEIDILASSNNKDAEFGPLVWCEVSVSLRPIDIRHKNVGRLTQKDNQKIIRKLKSVFQRELKRTVEYYYNDFQNIDKQKTTEKILVGKYSKLIVFGNLPSKIREDDFIKALKCLKIKAIPIKTILEELADLEYYRADYVRQAVDLFKTYWHSNKRIKKLGNKKLI